MIALAVEALAASALLMLVVLLVRVPVRHWFGAQVAYALWALPVLRLLLPPMPAGWRPSAAAPIAAMREQALVLVAPAVMPAAAAGRADAPAASLDWAALVAGAWVLGLVALLGWQVAHYARFRRRILGDATPLARVGAVAVVASAAADGPLAFGLLHRVVAFPRDFDARYDADERALALEHELSHHRRGDLWANWIALVVLALHWFNPLAWIAFRAFRADQEMANDAGVLAAHGSAARHAYGCAIVKAAHGHALTPACHLNTIAQVKGRLRMLARGRVSRRRIAAGGGVAAVLSLAALAATASGTGAAAAVRGEVTRATGVDLHALALPTVFAAAPARSANEATSTRHTRVVIVTDGRRQVYEGAAAEAYIAAHPAPQPPVPPVATVPHAPTSTPAPPLPPYPPAVPASGSPVARAEEPVVERACAAGEGGTQDVVIPRANGSRQTVICTDRIARIAADAETQARQAERAGRESMKVALTSLRESRAQLAANAALQGEERSAALAEMDAAIAELRAEAGVN